jgi:aldose 1-epimerase
MAEITPVGQIAGADVHSITLGGPDGPRVRLLDFGARLAELWVPDRNGLLADIVLGHDRLEDWQTHGRYVGATCGRYANRIADGRFDLDGRRVQVDRNEGANHLHGGAAGFDSRLWRIASHSATHVSFALTSPDGDMGFPGTLQVEATYRIQGLGLEIEMTATTDAPTVVNLVNHAYFNLAGHGVGTVLDQTLQVEAAVYLPVDNQLIPTKEVRSVSGTAFDFREARPIGRLLPGDGGFDHTLCLSAPTGTNGLRPCVMARDPVSGRSLRMATTEPGVQLYTGAHFNGETGKGGTHYPRFAGFAVETQRFPDSPNTPHFPSARLEPGARYCHRMSFGFQPS